MIPMNFEEEETEQKDIKNRVSISYCYMYVVINLKTYSQWSKNEGKSYVNRICAPPEEG